MLSLTWELEEWDGKMKLGRRELVVEAVVAVRFNALIVLVAGTSALLCM